MKAKLNLFLAYEINVLWASISKKVHVEQEF